MASKELNEKNLEQVVGGRQPIKNEDDFNNPCRELYKSPGMSCATIKCPDLSENGTDEKGRKKYKCHYYGDFTV